MNCSTSDDLNKSCRILATVLWGLVDTPFVHVGVGVNPRLRGGQRQRLVG